MKQYLIGGLVGALILFFWQFLSWSILGVHESEMAYHPNQAAVLECLQANLSEGSYFMPTVAPGTSQEDAQALMQSQFGKPWALVQYNESFDNDMTINMIRGLAVDLVAIMLLIWIMFQFKDITTSNAIITSLIVGVVGYLTITYTNGIWFEKSTISSLLDAVVPWALIGAWLGWYLRR